MTESVPNPELEVDVHLLLGKVLKDEEISVEFAWRISSFFRYLYFEYGRPPQEAEPKPRESQEAKRHQVAVLSGYRGEAFAAAVRLQELQHMVYLPGREGFIGPTGRGIRCLETQAPNSRLNIQYAIRVVRQRGYLGKIRLYLHSSKYHVEDLAKLCEKFPKEVSPFSYVENGVTRCLGDGDVTPMPAPYLFPTCGIPEIEWLAKVYLNRQHLRLAWENIRAISGVPGSEELAVSEDERRKLGTFVEPGAICTFHRDSFDLMSNAITEFEELGDGPSNTDPQFHKRIERAREDMKSFDSEVCRFLKWLPPLASGEDGWKIRNVKERKDWETWARRLEPVLNPTHIGDIDPDTAGSKWIDLVREHAVREHVVPRMPAPEKELPLWVPLDQVIGEHGAFLEDQLGLLSELDKAARQDAAKHLGTLLQSRRLQNEILENGLLDQIYWAAEGHKYLRGKCLEVAKQNEKEIKKRLEMAEQRREEIRKLLETGTRNEKETRELREEAEQNKKEIEHNSPLMVLVRIGDVLEKQSRIAEDCKGVDNLLGELALDKKIRADNRSLDDIIAQIRQIYQEDKSLRLHWFCLVQALQLKKFSRAAEEFLKTIEDGDTESVELLNIAREALGK